MDLKQRKFINNLPKFDIGKMPVSSGYQQSLQTNLSDFSSTPGYDYSNDAKSLNKSNVETLAVNAASTGKLLYDSIDKQLGMISGVHLAGLNAAVAANASNAATLANTAGSTSISGVNLATGASGTITTNGLTAAEDAYSAGTAAATGASAALGYVTGGIGAALGTIGLVGDITGLSNRLHTNDIINSTSKQTETKYGQTYSKYGATDVNSLEKYMSAERSGTIMNTATHGLGTGAGIGSIVGTAILPGIGTLIGTGIGAVAGGVSGLIGGIFGGNSRRSKERLTINNTITAMNAANLQAEAEAGSEGLRNQFASKHGETSNISADKGKNKFSLGKPSFIFNSNIKGTIQGQASHDEMWRNPIAPLMERVGYFGSKDFNKKDERKDNVNLYGNIGPLQIAGHDENAKIGNKYIATLGRPIGKRAEQIKDEYKNTDNPYRKAQLENEMSFLDKKASALLNIQEDIQNKENMKHYLNYRAMNGKNKFSLGKPSYSDYLVPLATHSALLGVLLNTPSSYNPVTYNSFSENPYKNLMRVRYDDPTQALRNVDNATRQAIYSTNQAGSLSSGTRLKLINSALLSGVNDKNNIINQYNQTNNKYWMDWRDGMIKMGESEATRKQDATERYLNRQQEAYGTAFNAKQAKAMSLMNTLGSMAKDYMSANQFDTSRDFQQRLIDMYGNQLNLDKQRLYYDMGYDPFTGKKLASTVSTAPKYIWLPSDSWRNIANQKLTFDLGPFATKSV